jgi:hypothetical protein
LQGQRKEIACSQRPADAEHISEKPTQQEGKEKKGRRERRGKNYWEREIK